MTGLTNALTLATLFIDPAHLPTGARLWMLLPLVACVAAVYRATRVRTAREMPWATVRTFVSIVVGMALIAAAFYVAYLGARRYF